MMAYVVIVCSRCRLARGAPETARTASCPGCGRKLRVPELRKHYRTESLGELAEAIGQLNARLKGGLDAYLGELGDRREKSPGKRPPATPQEREPRAPATKLDRAILETLSGRAPATSGEILPLISFKCSLEQLEKRLEALRRSGILFEPRPGEYALVR